MVEVSIILPSKDEEETIGLCIIKIAEVLKHEGIDGEIIVSDNSQDKTPNIAKTLGAKVVTPDKPGYGYAYTYAFKYATGKIFVLGDADDTYNFIDILTLLEPLRNGESDFVIGNRFKGKMEKGAMPWLHRWVGNPILTWFLNFFFKAGISDSHSGFRAITRDAIKKLDLKTEGMEFASEMIIKAVKEGLRITEVPISYHKRKNENSKLSSFSDGWRHLKFMLLNTPNYLFIYPSLCLMFFGIFLMISTLFHISIGYIPGTHSMIAGSLLTITGYQTIFFGFFTNLYRRRSFPKFFSLEKGASLGILVFLIGFIYVITLVLDWINSGFIRLPAIDTEILGFTLLILGIQTFFSSFLLSIISEGNK